MNKETATTDALSWGLLEGSVGPRVRLLRNVLSARSITISAPYGLPTGSLTVLALIAANPGRSQSALAGRAGLNKSALVGIIDELEIRGLAARTRSETDRRRYGLTVTPEGERTIDTLFAAVTRGEAPLREMLGPQSMAQLIDLLDQAIAALDGGGTETEAGRPG